MAFVIMPCLCHSCLVLLSLLSVLKTCFMDDPSSGVGALLFLPPEQAFFKRRIWIAAWLRHFIVNVFNTGVVNASVITICNTNRLSLYANFIALFATSFCKRRDLNSRRCRHFTVNLFKVCLPIAIVIRRCNMGGNTFCYCAFCYSISLVILNRVLSSLRREWLNKSRLSSYQLETENGIIPPA